VGLNWAVLLVVAELTANPVQDGYVRHLELLGQGSAALTVSVSLDDVLNGVVSDAPQNVVPGLVVGLRRGDRPSSVFPCLPCAYGRDAGGCNTVLFCQRRQVLSFGPVFSDTDDVFGAELFSRPGASEGLESVEGVFPTGDGLQVFQVVVVLDPVDVVDYVSCWDRPLEGFPNESMNAASYGIGAWSRQPYLVVPVPGVGEFQESPCFGSSDRGEAAHTPSIGDLVGVRQLRNGLPGLCSHEPSVSQNRKGCTWV